MQSAYQSAYNNSSQAKGPQPATALFPTVGIDWGTGAAKPQTPVVDWGSSSNQSKPQTPAALWGNNASQSKQKPATPSVNFAGNPVFNENTGGSMASLFAGNFAGEHNPAATSVKEYAYDEDRNSKFRQ